VVERVMRAYGELARHLSRLLGDMGVQMLMDRSVLLASAQIPWLRQMPTGPNRPMRGAAALRVVMEQQESEAIIDAFVAILTTLVGLLNRLIGDELVNRLLHEVWPTIFEHESKDTP
jgi:hypothetical protein